MALRSSICTIAVLGLAACSLNSDSNADMPPPASMLMFVSPSDGQVGMKYGEKQTVVVRMVRQSATLLPVAGQEVRFSIFGDPAGSTLGTDRALTDAEGFASVELTAGAGEASFRVRASSSIAETIEFFVSVSKNELLDLDVVLTLPNTLTAGTVRALLYMDRTCGSLKPQPDPEPPLRELSAVAMPETLLPFRNLLAQSYAIVGRADGLTGKLLAWRCIDLPTQVVPPGAQPRIVVPLQPVNPTLGGTFTLEFAFASTDSERARVAPWRDLVRCPLGPAELLLSRLLDEITKDDAILADALAATRSAPGADGCRPLASMPDGALKAVLESGVADQLAVLVADLEAISEGTSLSTELSLEAIGPTAYAGEHRARTATFSDSSGADVALDLGVSGWFAGSVPITASRMGTATDGNDGLVVAPHTLPLGLPFLWRIAWETHSVATHLPQLQSTDPASLLDAVLTSASDGLGRTGCAAIAAALAMDVDDQATIKNACGRLPAELGGALAAAFPPTAVATPTLSIETKLVDSDGDLVVDTLQPGSAKLSDGRIGSLTGSLVH